jgi:hypothetical protein
MNLNLLRAEKEGGRRFLFTPADLGQRQLSLCYEKEKSRSIVNEVSPNSMSNSYQEKTKEKKRNK